MSNIDLSVAANETKIQDNNYTLSGEKINFNKLDSNGWVINNGNQKTGEINVIRNNKNQIIAVINSYAAIEATALSTIDNKKLENCWFIDSVWLSPNHAVADIAPLALYIGIKEARIYDKDIVLTTKDKKNNFPVLSLMKAKEIEELNKDTILIGQHVEYSLLYLNNNLPKDSADFITNEFVNDMYKMFFTWYEKFNQGSWCSAINNKTLTKNQYISTLHNLHSYVQYTTRICARAVAHSDDSFLRNTYIEHFRGEINHEILIEKDLKNLGEDVDYLKNHFIASRKTKAFMILQESTIGFYQDPILLLACPFVAEGISANFRDELLDNLRDIIASWGVKDAEQAMRFLHSHVKLDGGEDGHWEDVIKVLPQYITTEHDRQKFISIAKFGMDALLGSFDSNVDENLIW